METDILPPDAKLPRVKEGDIIAVEDVGAYSLTFSSQFMRPRPPVLGISGSKLRWLAKQETEMDVLRRMSFEKLSC